MRILVTGVSGYIGARLAVRLKASGHTVVGVDRQSARDAAVDEFVECDLMDGSAYRQAVADCDLVCHLAAARGDWGISDAEYYRDNLAASEALISVLEDAGGKPCIFYSTVSVLGPSDIALDESAPFNGVGAYGKSKADCEDAFRQYAARQRRQVVTIRPSAVFGPGDPGNTNVYRLIDMIFRNRFVMIGRGSEIKTTSYIDNLVDAHMFLMERMNELGEFEVFHYVDEPALSTADIVSVIRSSIGKSNGALRLPMAIAFVLALIGDTASAITGRDMLITRDRVRKFCTATNFSSRRIRDLGFRPGVPVTDAIQSAVNVYINERNAPSS